MPVISIIIPVYNVEKYLARCINSILKQTYHNFEIILLDDGSSDNSYKIMKKYSLKDKRIIIEHHDNIGPALTRNMGINMARGKYIMFIDSDDYVLSDYLEHYVVAIENGKYDLVIGGYQKITGTHIEFVRKLKNGEFSKYMVTGPVCKLYKKSFLVNNHIEFLNTTASEDVYFNVLAYSKNPRIKIINDIGYFYYYNPKSLSNTKHKGFNQDVDILGLVSAINYDSINNVSLNQYFIIRYLIWYLLYSGKGSDSLSFCYEYKKLFSWLKDNVSGYRWNKYIWFCPKGEYYKIHLFIHLFVLLDMFHLVKFFSHIYCKGRN